MKMNQLKAGSVLSYLQMAVGVIIGVIYTPVMIRLLGKSEYGLYNTVASTISVLSILSLGFNSSYLRYYSMYKHKNDKESIFRLNGLFLVIFLIIGIIALICGLFLSFNLETVFSKGLTPEEYDTAKVLMILLTVNLSVSFPMCVFSNIISANERYVFLKLLGMVKTVVGPLVTLPLLLMGYRSTAMVVVTLIISVLTDAAYFIYVVCVLKNKFIFKRVKNGIFLDLFIYTSFLALNAIVDQINMNMGKLLLGRYNGTGAVAVYSVGYSLYQYYMMFSTSISGVFSPRIHKIVNATCDDAGRQRTELTDLFVRVGRIQFLVLMLIATGLIFFGKTFISFWAGEGYENAYTVSVLLLFSSSLALIQNLGIEIQRAENKHRFRSIAYTVMALSNLLLTIKLCPVYGAVGAAAGTAASLIIANGIIMNIYYHKRCNIDIKCFWKNIARLSLGLIFPLAAGTVLNIFIKQKSMTYMLLGGMSYTVIYFASMWLFGMNRYEKDLIVKPINKIYVKLRRIS